MKILYISKLDWFWTKQRPQHIVEKVSINNKVDYLSIRPWKDGKSFFDKNRKTIQINNNLRVFRPRVSPKRESLPGEYISDIRLRIFISNLNSIEDYDVIICSHPHHFKYIPKNFDGSIIYDCMDDQLEMGKNKEKVFFEERELLKISDGVIVSSDYLKSRLLQRYAISNDYVVINNAVETVKFINYLKKHNYKYLSNKKKNVGYVGSIDTWMDFETINKVARKFSQVDFNFFGPINPEVNNKIKGLPSNVKFHGRIDYENVPETIYKFDIAIMPFINTQIVLSVNPVKIYEYLALGKTVIANDNVETRKFGDLICRYSDTEDFVNFLQKSLDTNISINTIKQRIDFVKSNSWDERADRILKFCEAIVKKGGKD